MNVGTIYMRCYNEGVISLCESHRKFVSHLICFFRSKLNGCCGFTKGGCPGVKVRQILFLECTVLEVSHDSIKLRHGVADRCAGCKDNSSTAGKLVHIAVFCQVKIPGIATKIPW